MPDLSSLASLLPLLSGLGCGDKAPTVETPESPAAGGGLDPAMLMKLLPLLQGAGSSSGGGGMDMGSLAKLLPLFSGLGGSGGGGAPDLGGLMKFLPLLSGGIGQEDENTALLRALRPHLHGEREKRLDGAIKLLQMSRVFPLLK